MRRLLGHTCAALGVVLLIHGIHGGAPVQYAHHFQEDGVVESTSFFVWLAAGILLLAAARRLERTPWLTVAAGLGALFVAFEEISWGQRLLGLKTPESLARLSHQPELNLHNLVHPGTVSEIFPWAILVFAVVIPALATRPGLKERLQQLGFPLVPGYLIPYFLGALWLRVGCPYLLGKSEMSESMLALAMLLLAADLFGPGTWYLGWGLYLACWVPGYLMASRFPPPPAKELNHAATTYRANGYPEQALALFRHLNSEAGASRESRMGQALLTDDSAEFARLLEEVKAWEDPEGELWEAYLYYALDQKETARQKWAAFFEQNRSAHQAASTPEEQCRCLAYMAMAARALEASDYRRHWEKAKELPVSPETIALLRLRWIEDRRMVGWLKELRP